MKNLILMLTLFPAAVLAQGYEDFYIVKNGDTTVFKFTEAEIKNFDKKKALQLRHRTRKKTKKIVEYSAGTIKFYHNDTTFWVGFSKFYDDYFIALIARKKLVRKSKYELYNYEYRRIYYSEVTDISTAGRNPLMPKDYSFDNWSYEVVDQ